MLLVSESVRASDVFQCNMYIQVHRYARCVLYHHARSCVADTSSTNGILITLIARKQLMVAGKRGEISLRWKKGNQNLLNIFYKFQLVSTHRGPIAEYWNYTLAEYRVHRVRGLCELFILSLSGLVKMSDASANLFVQMARVVFATIIRSLTAALLRYPTVAGSCNDYRVRDL